jgi:hypothetical protein
MNMKRTITSGSFGYTVYAGLRISGAAAAKLTNQLGTESGYIISTDSNGYAFRSGKLIKFKDQPKWVQVFSANLDSVMDNDGYRNYIKTKPATQITAVGVLNNTPGFFDKYANATFYPDNYQYAIDRQPPDGEMFAAAATLHALWEQYNTQIYEKRFDGPHAAAAPDDEYGGAYGAGTLAEEAVLNTAGWGQRFSQNAVVGEKTFTVEYHYIPKGGGRPNIVKFEYVNKNQQLISFSIKFRGGV